jgi:hypothetical protein
MGFLKSHGGVVSVYLREKVSDGSRIRKVGHCADPAFRGTDTMTSSEKALSSAPAGEDGAGVKSINGYSDRRPG